MVPKIEQFSQGAAVQFFQEIKDQDVYVQSAGYKSYAPYFYADLNVNNPPESRDYEWLYSGDIDKPVYFITKTTYRNISGDHVELLKTTGGFRIYVRYPEQ